MCRTEILAELSVIIGQEAVSIDEGLTVLIGGLRKLIKSQPGVQITILMAGGTGSGKTSKGAGTIIQAFPGQVAVFPIDMFYRGKRAIKVLEEQHGLEEITWDEPLALDLEEAARQLSHLKKGMEVTIPIYDFELSERVGSETLSPKPIIIAEGLFALHETLRHLGDLRLYVDVDVHGQIIRRVLRDIVRKRRAPDEILLNMAQVALPKQYEHVTTTRQYADIFIENDYRPETETLRNQGIGGPQVKIAGWPPLGRLIELGAEYLGTFEGYDRYFTANDRDLAATGEELRIREESSRLMLTYKGPFLGQVGERFIFTCSIEAATVQALMQYYREALVFVRKERRLFLLPGVLVSLDEVTLTNPHGQVVEAQQVTEVRLTGRSHDGMVEVHDYVERLGLDPKLSTTASYFSIALNPQLLPLG